MPVTEAALTTKPTLRERRLASGLSRPQLGRLAKCSAQTIRLFEGGYRPDTSPALARVERALRAYERLLKDEHRPGPNDPSGVIALTDQGKADAEGNTPRRR